MLPYILHEYFLIDICLGQSQDDGQNEGSDAIQLRKIFQQMELVKDDSQQRSWFLHEDEPVICRHLEDLISILV
jgi:hypothetical protein